MRKLIDKGLTVFFILMLLGTIGALSYVIANPRLEEKFTEFYLLDLEGETSDYPQDLKVGEEGRVLVGIINREQTTTSYRLEVDIDGVLTNQVDSIMLEPDEKWEQVVGFTPTRAGDKQKVEFLLYKDGQSEPYLKLHLWLDVTKSSN